MPPNDGYTDRFRPVAYVATGSLVVLSAVLVLYGGVAFPNWTIGLLIVWLGALPGLLYLWGLDRSPVPFFPIAGLYYVIFFGLPVFLAPLTFRAGHQIVMYLAVFLDQPDLDVLLSAATGIGLLIVAYYAVGPLARAKLPRLRIAHQLEPETLNILYWILLGAGLAHRYIPAVNALPSVGQFLDPAEYLALGGFYLQWRSGSLARGQTAILLLIILPLEVVWRVRYFFVTDIFFLVLFFFFVLMRCRDYKTLVGLAVTGISLALSYNVTNLARHVEGSYMDKLTVAAKRVFVTPDDARAKAYARDGEVIEFDLRYSRLVHRIGHLWVYQHVYEQSPDSIPYWYGETFKPLLTAVIPRVLYPDKPEERSGGKFGYRYGFLPTPNEPTSVNIPWIVELLANFGVVGVLIGMPLYGVLLGVLNRIFNSPGASDTEFLIGVTILFRLMYQESNFSVMTGSLPLLFVALYIYFAYGGRLVERMRV